MPHIYAPFSATQVEALNRWQQAGRFHPFTCGAADCRRELIATINGWVCPRDGCAYLQNWAHDFMVLDLPAFPERNDR